MRILVVDDDPSVTKSIHDVLRMEGYDACVRDNAVACIAETRSWHPDLILLDIMMPGAMSGLDALRVIRRESDVPVILITARSEDAYKVLGLEYADDYLVKPFSMAEMLGRIRAIMRRAGSPARERSPSIVRAGDLIIDNETRVVTCGDHTLSLTPIEYKILHALAARSGRVFSHEELSSQVWGSGVYVDPRTQSVHIRALRRKVESDPSRPRHLLTVRGVGYRYVT